MFELMDSTFRRIANSNWFAVALFCSITIAFLWEDIAAVIGGLTDGKTSAEENGDGKKEQVDG